MSCADQAQILKTTDAMNPGNEGRYIYSIECTCDKRAHVAPI